VFGSCFRTLAVLVVSELFYTHNDRLLIYDSTQGDGLQIKTNNPPQNKKKKKKKSIQDDRLQIKNCKQSGCK